MMRLASGGDIAQAEARQTMADKVAAGVEAQAVAASSVALGHRYMKLSPAKSCKFLKSGYMQTNGGVCIGGDRRERAFSLPRSDQKLPTVAPGHRQSLLLRALELTISRRERPTSRTKKPETRLLGPD